MCSFNARRQWFRKRSCQSWVFYKFGWVFYKFTENGEFLNGWFLPLRGKNRDACTWHCAHHIIIIITTNTTSLLLYTHHHHHQQHDPLCMCNVLHIWPSLCGLWSFPRPTNNFTFWSIWAEIQIQLRLVDLAWLGLILIHGERSIWMECTGTTRRRGPTATLSGLLHVEEEEHMKHAVWNN